MRNQQKVTLPACEADIDKVSQAIHGPSYNVGKIGGHPGTTQSDVDAILTRRNAYNAAIKEHRVWLKENVRDSRARNGKKGVTAQKRQRQEDVQNGVFFQEHDVNELVSGILAQLGVTDDADASSSSRSRDTCTPIRSRRQKANIVLQLRREIAADIEKSENESRATQQRMEGYWRYVNGTVTNRLKENASIVDRATGVIFKGDDARRENRDTLDPDQDDLPVVVENDGD
jgi:hypothetical protein